MHAYTQCAGKERLYIESYTSFLYNNKITSENIVIILLQISCVLHEYIAELSFKK